MAEFNITELQNQALKINPVLAIRCAKAARLLSDLQLSSNDEDESAKEEVTSELKRQLMKLERQLLKERENNKKMRFYSLMELFIWIGIFFCLCQVCFFLFFDFPNLY